MNTIKSDERHIVATLRARPEHRDEVKSLLMELVDPARDEPGCLYYDLYQNQSDPDLFYIIDGWASDEAVADHLAHPNVSRLTDKVFPLLAYPSSMTMSQRLTDPR